MPVDLFCAAFTLVAAIPLALAALFEGAAPGIKAINEPQRIACGAPDLAILRQGLMVGYVEAKDVGTVLDAVERTPQLRRYREALGNLILTDGLEFRWYVDGEPRRTVRLARYDGGAVKAERGDAEAIEGLLVDFLAHQPVPIGTPRELAERMARLTHFETGQASDLLLGWRQAFAEVLVADLDQPERTPEFADMFAQTLAYGLFSARVMHGAPGAFTRQIAQAAIPPTNPFLRDFFYQITGPGLDAEPYAGFVNDLVQVLTQADMGAILADFGKRTRREDPTVHFYETFLAAYDPALRESRGVYYTPAPVVSFIVRSVDALLKSHFGLPAGLADTSKVTVKNTDPGFTVKGHLKEVRKTTDVHKVLVLDPAVGTATFLYTVIDFELLMAPYAVAHFKLALQLAGHDLPEALRATWAYDFASNGRIGIYLTNSLEGPHGHTGLPLWTQFLARESAAADEIKQDLPIMVVLGTPPYSGHSANKSPWIDDLLHGRMPDGSKGSSYYEVDGKPLGERNPKWLQDDYVKFIRFGQWRIEQSGGGILAFISNNGYLDNPTFRGMRQSLMETFTDIYILDLHGNARKKEVAPDGTPDENVFDIMQGVAIGLFVKEPGKGGPARVHHAELWGRRAHKYQSLDGLDVGVVAWERLTPQGTFRLFVPQDVNRLVEYGKGWKVPEAFPSNSVGIVTARDRLTIQWTPDDVWQTINDFASLPPEEARSKYSLGDDARDWKVHLAQEDVRSSGPDRINVSPITYRPFDRRYTYYTGRTRGFICRPRPEIMHHMRSGDNRGLHLCRQIVSESWQHVLVTNEITDDCYVSTRTRERGYTLPLYTYPEARAGILFDVAALSPWPPDDAHGGHVPNLAPAFVKDMEGRLGLAFNPHKTSTERGETFAPEDVFRYIYAILHSPTYRERYAEFLKIDFPRVPLTSDVDLFWQLVSLGDALVAYHLLEHPDVRQFVTRYPVPGNNEVAPRGGYPAYTQPNPAAGIEGRVAINRTQYFGGVPEDVWAFQVGGYQVCEKWLKDRRGRMLTFDELSHYQQVVVPLKETIRLMAEVDAAIPGWPVG